MIKVTAEKGRFIVSCPFHMNGLVQAVPGKRWSAPRRAYVVPFSRKAAEVLSSLQADIEFDRGAIELMAAASRPKTQKSTFPAWYSFKTKPMKHQRQALDFLWEKETAALFMGMRTGKTKTVIDWSCAMKMEGMIDAVLVFCPMSVRGGWEAQYAEHAPIEATVGRFDLTSASGKKAQKAFADGNAAFKVMVVAVESMAAGKASDWVYDFVKANGRVLCVVDESHMIKTHNAKRSEVITLMGTACSHRVILTGTPTTASPLDLYSQFYYLDPDIIGFSDFYSFKARYAIMGGYENKQIIGYNNLDELMRDIAPYTFQTRAEDVADLPPKTYMVREVELPHHVRALYNLIERRRIIEHNGKTLILSNVLDRILRLSMLTNGVMATGEAKQNRTDAGYEYEWINSAKVEELMNVIEENPCPTVVWTTGRMELHAVVERLQKKGLTVATIHGGIDEEGRILAMSQFQDGTVDYLVANVSVGGTGTKFSRASMMVYMSNSFKYTDRVQSLERATDFQNVTHGVAIVDIVAKNTVDDNIVQPALRAKQDVAEFVDSAIKRLKLDEGL